MYLSGIMIDSIVDGVGVRNTLFVSGCNHNCKDCFNKETWDFNNGFEFTREKQLKFINMCKDNKLISGITLSGGDPIYSLHDVIDFVKLYRKEIPSHSIWLYTGFTFEDIISTDKKDILNYIDVLVDSEFDYRCKSYNLKFKGSRNQRVIDVQKSLKYNKLIEFSI